jgi:hypothetical protein
LAAARLPAAGCISRGKLYPEPNSSELIQTVQGLEGWTDWQLRRWGFAMRKSRYSINTLKYNKKFPKGAASCTFLSIRLIRLHTNKLFVFKKIASNGSSFFKSGQTSWSNIRRTVNHFLGQPKKQQNQTLILISRASKKQQNQTLILISRSVAACKYVMP